MPSIGDLANDLAQALYEQRIAVAILSIVGFIALIAVARRLGWFAAAARHPRRSAAAGLVALVVFAPVTWYLASPIFIRTELVEPAPVGAVTGSPSPAPASDAPPPPAPPSAAPTATPIAPAATAPPATAVPTPDPTPTPFAPTTVASGEFQGTDEFHFGRGTASIIEIEPGRYHLRLEDFSVRNGPDLFVYLSPDPDGYADDALELGVLKATDGSFGYDLPEGVDPARFRSAIIWCKQFSHLFATATF
jgi:hypothetical protein